MEVCPKKSGYREKLHDIPYKLKNILTKYHNDNDVLQMFINDFCEIDTHFNVNACSFRTKFNNHSNINISQDDLKELMKKKKFDYFSPYINGKRVRSYMGIKLLNE